MIMPLYAAAIMHDSSAQVCAIFFRLLMPAFHACRYLLPLRACLLIITLRLAPLLFHYCYVRYYFVVMPTPYAAFAMMPHLRWHFRHGHYAFAFAIMLRLPLLRRFHFIFFAYFRFRRFAIDYDILIAAYSRIFAMLIAAIACVMPYADYAIYDNIMFR